MSDEEYDYLIHTSLPLISNTGTTYTYSTPEVDYEERIKALENKVSKLEKIIAIMKGLAREKEE